MKTKGRLIAKVCAKGSKEVWNDKCRPCIQKSQFFQNQRIGRYNHLIWYHHNHNIYHQPKSPERKCKFSERITAKNRYNTAYKHGRK